MDTLIFGIFRFLTMMMCLFVFQVGYSRNYPITEYQLVVWFNEGYDMEKISVPFCESPEFTIDGNEVVFHSASTNPNYRELRFAHSDLDCFTLEEYNPEATNIVLDKSALELEDGVIKISAGMGRILQVVSLSGFVMEEQSVPTDGEFSFSITNIPSGTYIIRCGSFSCKVTI